MMMLTKTIGLAVNYFFYRTGDITQIVIDDVTNAMSSVWPATITDLSIGDNNTTPFVLSTGTPLTSMFGVLTFQFLAWQKFQGPTVIWGILASEHKGVSEGISMLTFSFRRPRYDTPVVTMCCWDMLLLLLLQ